MEKEEKIDPRLEELKETSKKVILAVQKAKITTEDADIKDTVASILDVLNEDKITDSEAMFVIQTTLGAIDGIFRALGQTIGEGKNDKLAKLFEVDNAGKILISDLTKS
jgi:hypothetical protein